MLARSRNRALTAVAAALALHALLALVVTRSRVRPLAEVDAITRIDIALVAPPAPPAPADARTRGPAPTAPTATAPTAPPVDRQTQQLAEMATPAAPSAPATAATPPSTTQPTQQPSPSPSPSWPRSFLERVIAGTSEGPRPSLDKLDPTLMQPEREVSDAERAARIAQRFAREAALQGAPPPADAGTVIEELEQLDDGSYRYTTGGFVATIHVDGSVTFVDKLVGGGPSIAGIDPTKDIGEQLLHPPPPDRVDPLVPFSPYTMPPGVFDNTNRKLYDGALAGPPRALVGVSGSFDPTAVALKAMGQDPYEHEKLCFLDETQELRAELRTKHEGAQMAGLRRALERAWFDDRDEHGHDGYTRSVAETGGFAEGSATRTPRVTGKEDGPERRAKLFEIWDECREEEIGLMARELVESFIRQHLPLGSPDAYSEAELAALNARRTSTMEFRPYG